TGSLAAVREAAQASDGRPAYDLLAEAARAVHGSVELEAKLAWTVDAARSITRATHAAYVCFDDDTGEPWLVAGSGVALDDLALVRLSRVFGPITAGPVQVDDTRLHARPRSGRGTSTIGSFLAATKDALAVTHALRFLAIDGCPLDRMVVRADELVRVQSPELVATVVVARYSPESGVVRLVGAGHPPALVVSRAGDVREVDAPGVPIGWPGAGSDQVVPP